MDETVKELKEKIHASKTPFILKIKVIANAKNNSIEKYEEGIYKVKINKPAVEGKANKAIIEFLSAVLDVQKSAIVILRGEKNSLKDLRITLKSHII